MTSVVIVLLVGGLIYVALTVPKRNPRHLCGHYVNRTCTCRDDVRFCTIQKCSTLQRIVREMEGK